MALGRIAFLNPLTDYGQNTYTHELAEAMGEQGEDIVFVTAGAPGLFDDIPPARRHDRQVVMGSFLIRQRGLFRRRVKEVAATGRAEASSKSAAAPVSSVAGPSAVGWRSKAMTWELLLYLKAIGVEWMWTQWSQMDPYDAHLWRGAKQLGMKVAHTVHNVLPHEPQPKDREDYGRIYRESQVLFVHSEQAGERLFKEFPDLPREKVHMHRIGAYTVYPRLPEQRKIWRERWNVKPEQTVWLVCGLIRPYKNVNAVLEAMAGHPDPSTVLVVQGKEAGFAGARDDDPLGQTRRRAAELGIEDRVQWVPGYVSIAEMSGLLEAADGLLLPYRQGSGSALLSVGLAFGVHLLAAPVGGAEEYLSEYGWGTLLADCGVEDIRRGLAEANDKIRQAGGRRGEAPASLGWPEAARQARAVLRNYSR